jgi:hypothetical protein
MTDAINGEEDRVGAAHQTDEQSRPFSHAAIVVEKPTLCRGSSVEKPDCNVCQSLESPMYTWYSGTVYGGTANDAAIGPSPACPQGEVTRDHCNDVDVFRTGSRCRLPIAGTVSFIRYTINHN